MYNNLLRVERIFEILYLILHVTDIRQEVYSDNVELCAELREATEPILQCEDVHDHRLECS